MFINTAKNLNIILDNYEKGIADKRQVEFSFKLHRDGAKFYLENKDAEPKREHYEAAANHIRETIGVILTPEQTRDILILFPSARIKLAVYDGTGDTEVRDLISDAAFGYFAGTEAPSYGDKVDVDRFFGHLKYQAKEMGYSVET